MPKIFVIYIRYHAVQGTAEYQILLVLKKLVGEEMQTVDRDTQENETFWGLGGFFQILESAKQVIVPIVNPFAHIFLEATQKIEASAVPQREVSIYRESPIKESPLEFFFSDNTPKNLEKIAQALKNSLSEDHVALVEVDSVIRVFVRKRTYQERILDAISTQISQGASVSITPDKIKATSTYLGDVFGSARFERICKQWDIPLETRGGTDPFKRGEIQTIFAAACEVYIQDIEELLNELQDREKKQVRFLSEEETAVLKEAVQTAKSIDGCTKPVLNKLFSVLSPFKKLEDIFLKNAPPYPVGGLKCAKNSWEGLQDRVLGYETIRRMEYRHYKWTLIMGIGIASKDIPLHVLIPHKNGVYENFACIEADGAWKYLLKHRGKIDTVATHCVLFRGTRFPKSTSDTWSNVFTTLFEDARYDIGSKGPQATYEQTFKYYTDPSMGFISTQDEKIRGIGTSLGGAHLQREVALFSDRFVRMSALRCPAIDVRTCEIFSSHVKERFHDVKIEYFLEDSDIIDEFGHRRIGASLSENSPSVKFYITGLWRGKEKLNIAQDIFWKRERPTTLSEAAFAYNTSASGAHNRPTYALDHFCAKLNSKQVEDKEMIESLLGQKSGVVNPVWEMLRSKMSVDKDHSFADFLQQVTS